MILRHLVRLTIARFELRGGWLPQYSTYCRYDVIYTSVVRNAYKFYTQPK